MLSVNILECVPQIIFFENEVHVVGKHGELCLEWMFDFRMIKVY